MPDLSSPNSPTPIQLTEKSTAKRSSDYTRKKCGIWRIWRTHIRFRTLLFSGIHHCLTHGVDFKHSSDSLVSGIGSRYTFSKKPTNPLPLPTPVRRKHSTEKSCIRHCNKWSYVRVRGPGNFANVFEYNIDAVCMKKVLFFILRLRSGLAIGPFTNVASVVDTASTITQCKRLVSSLLTKFIFKSLRLQRQFVAL